MNDFGTGANNDATPTRQPRFMKTEESIYSTDRSSYYKLGMERFSGWWTIYTR